MRPSCCRHLPGNDSCPYPALFVVSWALNEPAAFEVDPPEFRVLRSMLCAFHLVPEIEDRLARDVPNTFGHVEVATLLSDMRRPARSWVALEPATLARKLKLKRRL